LVSEQIVLAKNPLLELSLFAAYFERATDVSWIWLSLPRRC